MYNVLCCLIANEASGTLLNMNLPKLNLSLFLIIIKHLTINISELETNITLYLTFNCSLT